MSKHILASLLLGGLGLSSFGLNAQADDSLIVR